MKVDTLRISIRANEDNEPTGRDSVIARTPPELYRWIGDKLVPNMGRLAWFLTRHSHESAAHVGELLHHADWVMTTDPAIVLDVGMQHDCSTCQAGTDQGLARLKEFPEEPLLVGLCFWAGPL